MQQLLLVEFGLEECGVWVEESEENATINNNVPSAAEAS